MCSFFLLVHVLFFSCYRNIRRNQHREGSLVPRRLVFTDNPDSLQEASLLCLLRSSLPSEYYHMLDNTKNFTFDEILILLRFSVTMESFINDSLSLCMKNEMIETFIEGRWESVHNVRECTCRFCLKTGFIRFNRSIERVYSRSVREIIISSLILRRGKHFLQNINFKSEIWRPIGHRSELFLYSIRIVKK